MSVISRLAALRRANNVLNHPFYVRWSAGELSGGELAVYAGEYREAVRALARVSEQAAQCAPAPHKQALTAHAREEAAHVEVWERFARGCGWTGGDARLQETAECAASWTAGRTLLEHLAILYVLEGAQPEISRVKLGGLIDHYGYSPDSPATDYFRVHAQLDLEHAREARELIEELMDDPASEQQTERMLACAEDALRGNWALLDGVEAAETPASLA